MRVKAKITIEVEYEGDIGVRYVEKTLRSTMETALNEGLVLVDNPGTDVEIVASPTLQIVTSQAPANEEI